MRAGDTTHATVAVKDLEQARRFYGQTLGLNEVGERGAGVMYESGGGKLYVYPSDAAGSGAATTVLWEVEDLDATVDELKGKGVEFEHFEIPGMTREGDTYVQDGNRAAWFKDPDGNILAVGVFAA